MKIRLNVLTFGVIFSAIFLLFSACKKINESTELGQDIIPLVDNINTFDTTLTVEAYNNLLNDTIRLSRNEEHFLGKINNDPLFGKTDAKLFLELKPTSYPWTFERIDSLTIDSVVLVLGYDQTFGDTLADETVNVYQLDNSNDFRWDSVYNIRTANFTHANNPQLGTKTFKPATLKDSVYAFRDTTNKQLRIKLLNSFGQTLLNYDSTNAYRSDSAFRTYFKGFALQSVSVTANAVMGFNLNSINTKLAIYYHYPKPGGAGSDTTVSYFRFTSLSANANNVTRDYTGFPITNYLGVTSPQDLVFLQNSPGTFATIKIPALASLSNRIVHRAELIVEQVYHISDATFPTPDYMFLDAYDTSAKAYRTIAYDLTLDQSGAVNQQLFGMIPKSTVDASNNPIKVWKFNISRYVQHVLTRTEPLYDLRLVAPFFVNDLYKSRGSTTSTNLGIFVNPTILKGRVRVGGGNHATQKMRLRIIYTKI